MRPWMIMLVLVLSATACSDGDSSTPTSPTPSPTPAPGPTPPPAPTTAALTGTVSTTGGQRIGGARITVLDGPNSGQSVQANGSGEYRFESLAISNANFAASAAGYLEDRRGAAVDGTSTLNFVLSPIPIITVTSRITSGGPGVLVQEWAFTAVPNVPLSAYDWDFGDGAVAFDRRSQESHVYQKKGKYKVTVTGRRSDGPPVVGSLEIEVI
jgi:PKD repeat protein